MDDRLSLDEFRGLMGKSIKTIAVMQADLERTSLGTVARLGAEIGGVTVLRRTVDRLLRVPSIDSVHVLCPSDQHERVQSYISGTSAYAHAVDAPPAPWSGLIRAGRKWSLDGWRGGIGGSTYFDEFTDPRVIAGLLEIVPADAVLVAPPAAPVIDPQLAEAMIEHRRTCEEDVRLVFTQAPPGLSGLLLDADLIREIAPRGAPVGSILSYNAPVKDLALQACCLSVSPAIRYATGRLVADTSRSFENLVALLGEHPDPTADECGAWLQRRERESTEPAPREVELELTTDDPFPGTILRARGSRVDSRGPVSLETVKAVIQGLAEYDDALLVLGGFGDPLRHPAFTDVLRTIREMVGESPLFALAVRTTGVDLSDATIEALIANRVDLVQIQLDAWTQETYAAVQTPDAAEPAALESVLGRMQRLRDARQAARQVTPLILPDMTKAQRNVHELDAFHDGWLKREGAVSISGFSHCAGQIEDVGVMNMAPPARESCRRIRSRCVVLADGRSTLCDQDINGAHSIGNVCHASLSDLWHAASFEQVRQAHRAGAFDVNPLCAACADWHRP